LCLFGISVCPPYAYYTDLVGCKNCQAYVRRIGEAVPPSSLSDDTQGTSVSYTVLISVLIIGCGSYQPIEQYITSTSSPYPVYANPSLSLYKAFEFKSSFTDKAKDDPEKDYMVGQGSTVSRVLGGVKSALGDLGNFGNQGPMAQNGGEVIMTPGESNATIQEDKLMKRWPMRVYLQNAEYSGSYRYLQDIKLARCQALIKTTIV
jgi:hypothetical protein